MKALQFSVRFMLVIELVSDPFLYTNLVLTGKYLSLGIDTSGPVDQFGTDWEVSFGVR